MSKLDELRAHLARTNATAAGAGRELAETRARHHAIEQAARVLRRTARTDEDRRALARLEEQREALAASVARGAERAKALRAEAGALLGAIAELADPGEQLAELDDHIPILLFPVRLETRFRPGELWVRIYPDDCSIDAFEPLLTETEIDNLTSFWIAWWRAGTWEAQERGAWRTLVGGSGSGRAAWLIGQYQPANLGARPSKASADDVILVVRPRITLTAAERAAADAYWRAIWQADGDLVAEAAALASLRGAVGGAARAGEILEGYAPDPAGWDPAQPRAREDVTVRVAVLELPPPPATKVGSWTEPPRAAALPDRFVAMLFRGGAEVARVVGAPIVDGLATGPDPSLPKDQQIGVTDEDLALNDELRWVADFARACEVGMGLRIPMTSAEAAAGFDRLLVLGVRISSDPLDGKARLEALIEHQLTSKAGYGLVPQGSPTNNTEAGGAAHTWVDDPDGSYDRVFLGKEAYAPTADPFARRDGEWLAEALDLDEQLVMRLPHAAGTDQSEARAMNVALWNATLGYSLEEMLAPVVSRDDLAATRQFFTQFVSGRGPLPAVRVGRQPYGILVTTAFSRYAAPRVQYPHRLHGVLARMDTTWRSLAGSVAHVGRPGDAHQILLDIVGLHAGSVEYHQRYAESLDQLWNKLVLETDPVSATLLASWMSGRGDALLQALGAPAGTRPPIASKFFFGTSPRLTGPVVDDVPLSERAPVRACTSDGRNYLEWLSTSSLETIRRQDLGGTAAPTALLYLLLRHSVLLAQWDAGLRFLEARGLVDALTARREPAFIHLGQAAAGGGESKLHHLIRPQPAITGDATTTLAEYVLRPSVLASAAETLELRDTLAALGRLTRTPTARLERVFAEHLDCASYRLDAWKTGLAAARLRELRATDDRPRGIHLGAFGWLENLRPRPETAEPVQLPPELARQFQRPKDAPLRRDPANAGYIHAPSLHHAGAAAILKNAYRVHATPARPDAMAVNLSSARTRQALAILEGIRNGQTLAALLGYRFERGLHDLHALAEVDQLIFPLRQLFPLVANQLQSTADPTADITLLEARNVVDGVKLVEHAQLPGRRSYPFGFPLGTGAGQLPPATLAQRRAIDAEIDRLLDLHDALGDLMTAESVYQVVRGNFERAAAATTALAAGARPPEIEIVDTPRQGRTLNQRVALHLDAAAPISSPSAVPLTPRARAESPLNRWLAGRLPDPDDVVVQVAYRTPAIAGSVTTTVSQRQLALQPIDLLYLVNLELEQAMTELGDRIVHLLRTGAGRHPGLDVTLEYTVAIPGRVTFFELAPLLGSVRTLVLGSRHLVPEDLRVPLEASAAVVPQAWDDGELAVRVGDAVAALTVRRDALVTLAASADPLDAYAEAVSAELLRVALHGVPQTGTGQIHGDLRAIYGAVDGKLREVVARWTDRAARHAQLMSTWPTLSDAARIEMLRRAELLVATSATAQPPADPAAYRVIVLGRKAAFDAVLAQLATLGSFGGTELAAFVAAAQAVAPSIAAHDVTPFELTPQTDAMTTLRAGLVQRVTALAAELTARIDEVTGVLAGLASAGDAAARVDALLAAARRVLGDETRLVPRFQLDPSAAAELTNAHGASAALLTDLVAAGRRFPVDDWLYGVARVRGKLEAWENAAILGEAFGRPAAALVPLQLPFVAGDRWMALEFDPETAPPGDRLLYTAQFAAAFDATAPLCGLVVDEWPELVPQRHVTSGLAFHFDRPSSSPPQSLLLCVPPVLRGRWSWADLVATLHETLDAARSRAVEPAQLDGTAYGQVLPATVMAVTLHWITIATNLAMNNSIYDHLGAE